MRIIYCHKSASTSSIHLISTQYISMAGDKIVSSIERLETRKNYFTLHGVQWSSNWMELNFVKWHSFDLHRYKEKTKILIFEIYCFNLENTWSKNRNTVYSNKNGHKNCLKIIEIQSHVAISVLQNKATFTKLWKMLGGESSNTDYFFN